MSNDFNLCGHGGYQDHRTRYINTDADLSSNNSDDATKNQSAIVQPLPNKIPAPIFPVGISRVRWKPMPTADWGLVMGMRYMWAEHLAHWQWQYYIALDPKSPSYQWAKFDWGWQEDLEPLPTNSPLSTQPLEEEVTADE